MSTTVASQGKYDLYYKFCFALNELHRHVHGLPCSPAKAALEAVVEDLRELTQALGRVDGPPPTA